MQSNVLILTYWSYDDALIQTYTLPYLRIIRTNIPAGSKMILLTLEKTSLSVTAKSRIRQELRSMGIGWIAGTYHPFGVIAVMGWAMLINRLLFAVFRNKVTMIHCWGTPAGTVGAFLSYVSGKKLTIDSYEPHAEAMVENGTWKKNSLAFRLLFAFEKYQTKRAKYLIAAHEGMRRYALEKFSVDVKHMLVKPACVDLALFDDSKSRDTNLLQSLNLVDKIVCVYAGKFGGIYLDNEVFDFLKEAHLRWGDRFRVLLLTSHREEEINGYCKSAGLDRSIIVTRFVPHHEIPKYIGLGDFALTPVKPVPTKRYCTPIKDGEYWAMGLPVVIPSGISNDSEIIMANGIGAVLDRLDSAAYREALEIIDALLAQPREALRRKIRTIASTHRSFAVAERVYKEIYGQ